MGLMIIEKFLHKEKIKEVHYESLNQKITISSLGASITRFESVDVDNKFESIIMFYQDEKLYFTNPKFLGATIGPYAGRIYPAEIILNGKSYPLEKNFLNHSNLHSGASNIAFRNFDTNIINDSQVEFTVSSSSKDDFPGPVNYKILYTFSEDRLRIDYYAFSNSDTLINMTNHSYFNLSGDLKHSILDHELYLPSNHYVELDKNFIGKRKSTVSDTNFDFRKIKQLKQGILPLIESPTKGIDHPFYIDNTKPVKLRDPVSKRVLELNTSYNAIVVYTNNLITDFLLNNNQRDQDHYAICLEAQHIPNDIHFEDIPKSYLEANNTFHNFIEYKVSVEE